MNIDRDTVASGTLDIRTGTTGPVACVTLQGEADLSTLDQLRAALEEVDLGDSPTVHLHLAGLHFCDVTNGTALLAFAGEVRRHGGEVLAVGGNVWVRAMLTILDVAGDLPHHDPAGADGNGSGRAMA